MEIEDNGLFKSATDELEPYLDKVFKKWFPAYDMGLIRPFFYYKQKMKNGRTVFAFVRKTKEFEKHLMNDFDVQYLLLVDGNIWPELSEEDKERLIRHELRHIYIDADKNGEPVYKLADHDLIDFREDYRIEQGEAYKDPFLAASNTAMEVYFRINEAKKKQKHKE